MAAGGRLAAKLELLHHPDLSQSLAAFQSMLELRVGHAHVITSGRAKDLFTVSRLLAFCAVSSHGDLRYAKSIFTVVERPTASMHNSMIRGFSRSAEPAEGARLYPRMLRLGISPDKFTFPFLIRCCSLLSSVELGRAIHCHVVKFGFDSDVFVANNGIAMYSSCGDMSSARRLFDLCAYAADVVSWTSLVTGYLKSGSIDLARWFFDRMPSKNLVSWNAMIAGYARGRRTAEAGHLFDVMPDRNAASWGALVSGYAQSGLCKEALAIFKEMVGAGARPNEPGLVSAVSACAQLRALEEGEWVHRCIEEYGIEPNVTLWTALVDMYGKCGDISRALATFDAMPYRNIYSWNSIIAGLAMNGHGRQTLILFWKMLMLGQPPNAISFLGVLAACSHTGLVDEGQKLFELMTRGCGIRPLPEHYGCMVDLLGRAGLIEEAQALVEGMPFEPHAGLLGALAGACKLHGDDKLGEQLGKKYALLSNIYAAARRWDDVVTVRNLLKERGVMKIAGSSMVDRQ
ncbi:unnamed protein product [Spirodela intermedia]|uniref:Uncharacterized protein n=1 Tax=Spirodela intermedia TaxID=51605 RepID=A0A7I8ID62_SPIIN|nr:unnamed protein product [Spirodela intermedia]CAA6655738.1 unnamed protein product [Spirodela intermedia]